jgi:hypothetical protein
MIQLTAMIQLTECGHLQEYEVVMSEDDFIRLKMSLLGILSHT